MHAKPPAVHRTAREAVKSSGPSSAAAATGHRRCPEAGDDECQHACQRLSDTRDGTAGQEAHGPVTSGFDASGQGTVTVRFAVVVRPQLSVTVSAIVYVPATA